MNAANAWTLGRMALILGMLVSVAVGSLVAWLLGGKDSSAGLIGGLIAGAIVFAGASGFAGVLLYVGDARVPGRIRAEKVRRGGRYRLVLEADMSPEFKGWIERHRLASEARISRFGVAIGAGADGLTIWAGTGRTPVVAATIDWRSVARLVPPHPAEYIGASTRTSAMTVVFRATVPDLRIPIIVMSSTTAPTGDYAETRAVIDELDAIRLAAFE